MGLGPLRVDGNVLVQILETKRASTAIRSISVRIGIVAFCGRLRSLSVCTVFAHFVTTHGIHFLAIVCGGTI